MELDGSANPALLKNKVVFWAIDGTLAPYRFNGHISDPLGGESGASVLEVRDSFFYMRKPSPFMQAVLTTCSARKHYAIERVYSSFELDDKLNWLSIYFPMIWSPIFVWDDRPGECKVDAILKEVRESGVSLNDVVYVDSCISSLRSAEKNKITAYHISSFLDYCC